MDTTEQYKKSIVSPFEPLENIERVNWYEDPVFIKMCEKAEEIQANHKDKYELHKWQTGDFLWDGKMACVSLWAYFDTESQEGLGLEIGSNRLYSFDHHQNLSAVWLPHQDQLQEMMHKQAYDLIRPFYLWCFDNCIEVCNYSMEQLWLAFVMKTCYNKEWRNGRWEKVNGDSTNSKALH